MRLAFTVLLAMACACRALASTAIPEEVTHIRDPFKKPVINKGNAAARSDLENYALDKFKLIGMASGPVRLRAMVQAPNNKTYFVYTGQRIGVRKGIVRKITPDAIHVREMVINVLGQEESVDTEIRMAPLGKDITEDITKGGAAVPPEKSVVAESGNTPAGGANSAPPGGTTTGSPPTQVTDALAQPAPAQQAPPPEAAAPAAQPGAAPAAVAAPVPPGTPTVQGSQSYPATMLAPGTSTNPASTPPPKQPGT